MCEAMQSTPLHALSERLADAEQRGLRRQARQARQAIVAAVWESMLRSGDNRGYESHPITPRQGALFAPSPPLDF